MSAFGDRLKEIRQQKDITQGQLAELTGLNQSAISQFEKGLRAPTPVTIKKIADALGVDKQEFFPKGNYEQKTLMRTVKGLTPEQIKEVTEYAQYIKSKGQKAEEK